MEVETIITIVTASLAFITSAWNLIYNINKGKKERIDKVILSNRIEYMREMRSGFSSMIALCSAGAVSLAQKDVEVRKVFIEKWFSGYGKIKTLLKPFYNIEKEILVALDALYSYVLVALNEKKEDLGEMDRLRGDFADKYLTYDWAYWKYIQEQKDGKYINSDDDFDKIYRQLVEDIDKGAL